MKYKSHRRIFFSIPAAFILALLSPNFAKAQSDTLHLFYYYSQTKMHDTTVAKIDKWIKSLNGQHVNINVYAYYSKAELKEVAGQRADDLFLLLNRKARSLFTIESSGPKKGKEFQRTVVDIVY